MIREKSHGNLQKLCLQTPRSRFFPTLGNGSFFLRLSGFDITGFRPAPSAPHAFSLRADLDEEGLEAAHFWQQDTLLHRLYLTPEGVSDEDRPDALIRDILPEGMPVFIRRIAAARPLTFKLFVPAYVEKNKLTAYPFRRGPRDCLRLFLRRGLPLADGFFFEKEATLFLFTGGTASFRGRDAIAVEPGEGVLYVVGDTPERALRFADLALSLSPPPDEPPEDEENAPFSPRPSFAAFSESASKFPDGGEPLPVTSPAGRKKTMIASLLAHQAKSGGVARSFDRPYVFTEEAPFYVHAFCSLGKHDRARALLTFFSERFSRHREFYPAYALDSDAYLECQNNDAAGLPILLAACRYLSERSDRALFTALYPMMTAALYKADRGLTEGVLPFSGAEEIFEEEPLAFTHLFDGSLTATLAHCDAVEKLSVLVKRFSRSLPRDNGHLLRNVSGAEKALTAAFPSRIFLNLPKGLSRVRRPRFARLACLGCYRQGPYPYTGVLEKNRRQFYLCPRCMELQRGFSLPFDPLEQFGERAAVVRASLFDSGRALFGEDRLARFLESEEADADRPRGKESGKDLALFFAACGALGLSRRRLFAAFLEMTDETGLPAVFYQDGSPRVSTPSPAALALLLASGFAEAEETESDTPPYSLLGEER